VAITLSRLSRRQTKDLVRRRRERLPSRWSIGSWRSDGIPLFVEELAQGCAESSRDLTGSLSGLEIPETLDSMARLDRLGEAKRGAAGAAIAGVPCTPRSGGA
jgi:predicted ATPase